MDTIRIEGLFCNTRLGVSKEERGTSQRVVVDLEIQVDLEPAARSDQLVDTVNYASLVKKVETLLAASHVKLIESLALRVCRTVLEDPRIDRAMVRIGKFPADLTDRLERVSVELSRANESKSGLRV